MLAGVTLLLANIFILASLLSCRNIATIISVTLAAALKFYLVYGEPSILHHDLSKGKVSISVYEILSLKKNRLSVYIETRNRHREEKNTINHDENT